MIIVVFFTSLFISQNVLADSASDEQIKVGDVPNQDPDPPVDHILDRLPVKFPKGIIPYFIESASYDSIIVTRIQSAMDLIEASSCLVFKQLQFKPIEVTNGSWIHFTNPEELRDCIHNPTYGPNREIIIILGYECMMFRNIVHAILHAIGFKDEVSHPHRDQYIRIMWENIQPRYRDLFRVQIEKEPYKVVEYDPMSIMHFHERAFSINGGVTIAPRMPGLLINPSDKLSQLDVMKLRLWFGHECNKRNVGALLEKCKTVFHNSPSVLAAAAAAAADNENAENASVEADDVTDPYNHPHPAYDEDGAYDQYDANDGNIDDDNEMISGNWTEPTLSIGDDGGVYGDDIPDDNEMITGNWTEPTLPIGDDGGVDGDDKGDSNNEGDDEVNMLVDENNDDGANEIPDDGARRKGKPK